MVEAGLAEALSLDRGPPEIGQAPQAFPAGHLLGRRFSPSRLHAWFCRAQRDATEWRDGMEHRVHLGWSPARLAQRDK